MAADAGVDDVDAHRRPGPAPAHDRGRAAPRPGRPGLRRLRPARPAHPARRRGPRQPHPPRARPNRARTSRSTSGRPPRTCWSTSTSTWWPWTAGTRAWPPGWPATRPAPPPQPADHAALPLVHGRPGLRAAHARTGAWAASSPRPGSRSSRSRPRSTPTPSPRRSPSCKSASGSGTCATGPPTPPPRTSLGEVPPRLARQIFHSIESPHAMTSVQAGEVEAVHAVTTENVWKQQGVDVQGQTDILTMGLPYICPYNVNSIMNPILVACLGLGYFFNLYRGKPAGARGRRADPAPPDPARVPPRPPPELHRLLRAGADPDRRPGARSTSSSRSPSPPTRGTSTSTAPATPTTASTPSTCGTGAPTRWSTWAGSSSSGGDPKAVRRLGFSPASSLNDALEIASDVVGPSPTLTHLHAPPIMMADVH